MSREAKEGQPAPVARRVSVFEHQLEQAGPLRMPGVGPWVAGSGRCASCQNKTRRRRCDDCTAALKAILASERRRLADTLLPWRWGPK